MVREGLFDRVKPEQRPGGRKGGREEATWISAKRKRRYRDPSGREQSGGRIVKGPVAGTQE